MGQMYEVQFAKQLDGADQYGNVTHSVKFTTESETALWSHQPQNDVTPGQKVFGRIEELPGKSGRPYRRFKKEQQEQGFTPTPSASPVSSGKYSGSSNSDGMRQGMSINNATALVTALIQTGVYTKTDPRELVADLTAYAKAIYQIDLTAAETVTDTEIQSAINGTLLDDVEQFFPGAVPANG